MRPPLRRVLVWSALLLMTACAETRAQDRTVLQAPDGTQVLIERDAYGVPSIEADTETGVFFGQGFAVAEDRLFQMETFRRAAIGRLAELDTSQFNTDRQVRATTYTAEEREQQFQHLPEQIQNMIDSYRAGVKALLDSVNANPTRYKPLQFSVAPLPEDWSRTDAIAVIQFFMRQFGQYGGEELTRLVEYQRNGAEWFDANRPLNDAEAPATIRDGSSVSSRTAPYTGPSVREEVIETLTRHWSRVEHRLGQVAAPPGIGSFAAVIGSQKSESGNVMLLGAPQLKVNPRPDEVSRAWEVELSAPNLHVSGMTVPGVPGVLIGRTDYFAWTLTSGNSDNTDTFIEMLEDSSLSRYRYDGEWRAFEVIPETIYKGTQPVPFARYRTVHGPVIGTDLANRQAFSWQMTFWNQELEMATAFYNLYRSTTTDEVEAAVSEIPMSFNVLYAGRDQNIRFWHVGKYPERVVDPRLPHLGDGTQEWQGFIPFTELPKASNPEHSYFVNWNNKPAAWWNNGDNIPWSTMFNAERTLRVNQIEAVVGPDDQVSFEELKDVPRQIDTVGTFQQVVEIDPQKFVHFETLLPPGESGFIDLMGNPSPHFADQWPLYLNGEYKPGVFMTGTADEEQSAIPDAFILHQNYPNPFNPSTEIVFDIPVAAHVSLRVYDLTGREVASLVNGPFVSGSHRVQWHAASLSSGVYFYRLTAGKFQQTRSMLLLK